MKTRRLRAVDLDEEAVTAAHAAAELGAAEKLKSFVAAATESTAAHTAVEFLDYYFN